MKKEFKLALWLTITFAALSFFMGVLMGILEEFFMGAGASGSTALVFNAFESIVKIIVYIYFPFLAVKNVTKWRKVDWSAVDAKALLRNIFIILFTIAAVTVMISIPSLKGQAIALQGATSTPASIGGFMAGAIFVALVIDVILLWVIFRFAVKRAKKKALGK